jgi:hypothetical protein
MMHLLKNLGKLAFFKHLVGRMTSFDDTITVQHNNISDVQATALVRVADSG